VVGWTGFVGFVVTGRAEYLMVGAEAALVIDGVDGLGDWD